MHLMKRYLPLVAITALCASLPLLAQEAKTFPAPSEIVAAAKADEWVVIESSDLMIMDLAPDSIGRPRRVVIQLIPEPFSQGWIGNIRKLAAAKFWDGTSINRVQDNYVVQWGDATEKKTLPEGLAVVPESEYVVGDLLSKNRKVLDEIGSGNARRRAIADERLKAEKSPGTTITPSAIPQAYRGRDPYSDAQGFYSGWPVASHYRDLSPTHCYGMVGVGRNLSPDTGTGAELYTVIGHAPRHLDRNIALVGRVIEGIEHMSSLPRGTGALGFYETEGERVPILSVRLGNDVKDVPAFEYLNTDSASFAAYADARANRRDPFFNVPAGGADICNIPVPIRRKAS
jgi:cyclophilin family peptidyl-prolyl cis-trans isomerase